MKTPVGDMKTYLYTLALKSDAIHLTIEFYVFKQEV